MIWAISDLHLDGNQEKPMDIFGDHWVDHKNQIFEDWNSKVNPDDAVLISGDISWALTLEQAIDDLKAIDDLPGEKYMIKGNHDYWWNSLRKMNALELSSINFIQNNSFVFRDTLIAGTRGWYPMDTPNFNDHDRKIYNRELLRLRNSLTSLDEKSKISKVIVMIHYPPFDLRGKTNDFVDIMKEHKVEKCIYGHLHAEGHKFVVERVIDDIEFICASSDYLSFKLLRIGE